MKTKILFWGAGKGLAYIRSFFKQDLIQIVGVVDKNRARNDDMDEKRYVPSDVRNLDFDFLMISSVDYMENIYEDAVSHGVPHEKILMPIMSRGQMVKCWDILSESGIQQINFLHQEEAGRREKEMKRRQTLLESKIDYVGNRVNFFLAKYQKSKNLELIKKIYEKKAADFIYDKFLEGEMTPGRNVIFDNRYSYREYMSGLLTDKEGLFLEFGVFEGRSINHMSKLLPQKQFYGFDSFEGLPENWYVGYEKGRFDLEGIAPKCNDNVTLVKGWFDKTLPEFLCCHDGIIGWLHIDCDIYSSAKYVLDTLEKRIVSGTIIMFDEYVGHIGYEQDEMRAFKEFIERTEYRYKYIACSSVWDEQGTYVAVAIEIL